MSNYIFKIKKGKIELEVSSDNKYFVITQYDKIFKDFTSSGKKPVKTEKQEEPASTRPEPVEPKVEPVAEVEETVEEEPEVSAEETEPVEEAMYAPDKDLDEFLYKRNFERDNPSKLKTEEQEQKEEDDLAQEVPENTEFEDIIQEKLQEQEEPASDTDEEEQELAQELRKSFEEEEIEEEAPDQEEEPQKNSKVYDILAEKLSVLPEEERNKLNLNCKEEIQEESQIPSRFRNLEDLISIKKPQTKLDYLLLTAYCLQEKEGAEKYSLKQINSAIVPHLKEPIDHSVIHEAVGHEYFEVVPDYTGSEGITEYTISKQGEDYILNEL